MKGLYQTGGLLLAIALCSAGALAQRTQSIESSEKNSTAARPTPPPRVIPAKYMGGYAGYRKKQEGMLTFDDRNSRLVFRDKDEKEILSIPYQAVMVAFADSETRRLMGDGTRSVVMGTGGILAAPALLLKKKFEYLTIEFEDPDTYLKGVTQFKLEDKEAVEAVAHALAEKAGLTRRGQIFVRRRKDQADEVKTSGTPDPR